MLQSQKILILPGTFGICRLDPTEQVPQWAVQQEFSTVTRSPNELSIICPQENIPPGVQREGSWKAMKLEGPFAFSEIGILSSLLAPLARARISILAVSTYNTDYVFVQQDQLDAARKALTDAHYSVEFAPENR